MTKAPSEVTPRLQGLALFEEEKLEAVESAAEMTDFLEGLLGVKVEEALSEEAIGEAMADVDI